MKLRRKLFRVWCGLTIGYWLLALFGGDWSRIALKFQVGGWRAAYVHLALGVAMAVVVPLAIFFIGRAAFWITDQFRAHRYGTATKDLP